MSFKLLVGRALAKVDMSTRHGVQRKYEKYLPQSIDFRTTIFEVDEYTVAIASGQN